MRILQVICSLATRYGGPQFLCMELSRELVQQGHQVSIYSSDVDGDKHLELPLDYPVLERGVEYRYFRGWTRPGKYMVSPGLWRALRQTVADFDVVHISGVYSFSTSAAAYWCRRREVPYIAFPHGSLDPFLRRRNRPRKWFHAKLVAERDYRKASAILFNSTEEMRLASDWSGFARSEGRAGERQKQFVVYGGVGSEWLEERDTAAGERFLERFPELRGRRLVVNLGRINFKKGLDILIRSFAQIARGREDLRLVLDGPDNEGYGSVVRRLLAEHDVLGKTTLTGLLEGKDRFAVMQQAEVFALPSYTENFGLVVAEAMSTGVPVVISDQVNIWPEVLQADAGLVVPCDPQATAEALRSLLDDPARARQMGRNGRKWVAEHLSWNVVGAQMIRVYEEIVRDHRERRSSQGEISGARRVSLPVRDK
jgi:glycosyltransferase involved in cell wall biosynthesis